MDVVIFTDLDGTMLDQEDYCFDDAGPTLERLRALDIPLIMTTSKTRAEVEKLRDSLGNRDPFIVENGGGIFFPAGYRGLEIPHGEAVGGFTLIRLGRPYGQVRQYFRFFRDRFRARGFGDLSTEEVAGLTDLSPAEARLAREREFTEPFLLDAETEMHAMQLLAEEGGMKITRGGRFFHLIGKNQDKGLAVQRVLDIFRPHSPDGLISVGVGDSENDISMLAVVDIPVLIPRPVHGHLSVDLPGLVKADREGCRGWNDTLGRLLDELLVRGDRSGCAPG